MRKKIGKSEKNILKNPARLTILYNCGNIRKFQKACVVPMDKITSRSNPKIKYACSLKNNYTGDFLLAEGLRLCRDAAQNGVPIRTCFLSEKMLESGACAEILAASEETYCISESVCDKLGDTKNPQGVFCICRKPATEHTVNTGGKYLFLENVRDPGNFGTMLRTAEAFGLSGIMAAGCCEVFAPKVLRASMGAVFRFPVIKAENAGAFLSDCISKGMHLYCAVVDSAAADVAVLEGKSGIIAAVGNEANGLSGAMLALGESFTIHMAGRAESFNASQAATVIMYEMSK